MTNEFLLTSNMNDLFLEAECQQHTYIFLVNVALLIMSPLLFYNQVFALDRIHRNREITFNFVKVHYTK